MGLILTIIGALLIILGVVQHYTLILGNSILHLKSLPRHRWRRGARRRRLHVVPRAQRGGVVERTYFLMDRPLRLQAIVRSGAPVSSYADSA